VAGPRVEGTNLTPVTALTPPVLGDEWVALSEGPLPIGAAVDWATLPSCGAVVSFNGTSRDHAGDRSGITALEYEAYDAHVEPRLTAIIAAARQRWPELGRMALLHRTGSVPVGESSVVVVASAPHRGVAFEAARFGIDTLKSTVPVWKKEIWPGGAEWVLDNPIDDVPGTTLPEGAPA
jgi:molybdopterin synthase catalytic subunit